MTNTHIQRVPRIGDLAHQEVETLRAQDKLVVGSTLEGYPNGCPNCGGTRYVYFVVCSPQKLKFPPGGKHMTRIGGYWHVIEETKAYPCPVCFSESAYHGELQKFLWEQSGLEGSEHDWRVQYIAGMEGKENAHDFALGLLSLSSLPATFSCLTGNYGVGKTGVLKALCAQFIKASVPAHYTTAEWLLSSIRSTYSNGNNTDEIALVNWYNKFKFLAIDEIDVIGGSEWALSTMRMIVDQRYSKRASRATLFATNKPMSEIWGYLRSRLDDGFKIPMTGQSLRGAA